MATRDVPRVVITKNDRKKKPAIINVYNYTNGGTDIQDQRMSNYSTTSKSNKWTRKVLSYLLDTARVNAQTIFALVMKLIPRSMSSFDFLIALAEALVKPHVERRPLKGLTDDIIRKMSTFLNRTIDKTAINAGSVATPALEPKNVTTRAKRKATCQPRTSAPKASAHRSKIVQFENTGSKRKCSHCVKLISGKGHKKAKKNLYSSKWQCSSCSKPLCINHQPVLRMYHTVSP